MTTDTPGLLTYEGFLRACMNHSVEDWERLFSVEGFRTLRLAYIDDPHPLWRHRADSLASGLDRIPFEVMVEADRDRLGAELGKLKLLIINTGTSTLEGALVRLQTALNDFQLSDEELEPLLQDALNQVRAAIHGRCKGETVDEAAKAPVYYLPAARAK
jgi:hypothetical protein